MARESFEDPAVAALLNRSFVSIKVDREERPDVDRIFMAFVQATTGGGGWPMSVWLTPEGHPFHGGTYFPPTPHPGRPSFTQILLRIEELWRDDTDRLRGSADHAAESMRAIASGETDAPDAQTPPRASNVASIGHDARQRLLEAFDPLHGGFGRAPKFPQPALLEFLLSQARREPRALEPFLRTLEAMAIGGIHDHLGGGFHRYAVDQGWCVPHFEKMLYDQAQLASLYVKAFQITGKQRMRETAEGIFDYVLRDLRHPEGGFFSAEDADSDVPGHPGQHGEGAFYTWRVAEIGEALGTDAASFCEAFQVVEAGNAPPGSDPHEEFHGLNILRLGASASSDFADSKAKLFAARSARPRPSRDEKILCSWNGMMISALAQGANALRRPDLLEAGIAAAEFLLHNLRPQGELRRAWRDGIVGAKSFADDYANLGCALLDLHEAGAGIRFLNAAAELQEEMNARFADPEGGWYLTDGTDPTLFVRPTDDHDGAEPSATAVGASNLVRLSRIFDRPDWLKLATRAAERFADTMAGNPLSFPLLLVAWAEMLDEPVSVTIDGPHGSPQVRAFLDVCARYCIPGLQVIPTDGLSAQDTRALGVSEPSLSAHVCRNFACGLPLHTPAALDTELRTLAVST